MLPGTDLDLPPEHPFWAWCDYAEKLQPFRPSDVVGAHDSPLNPTGYALSPEEARADDAPFPTEAHCAGARAFPPLNVMRANPGADLCRGTWERLASFDRPFVTAMAEHEPSFGPLAPLFHATVPGARGRNHLTIPGAGHFLQEHAPEALVKLVNEVDRRPSPV